MKNISLKKYLLEYISVSDKLKDYLTFEEHLLLYQAVPFHQNLNILIKEKYKK